MSNPITQARKIHRSYGVAAFHADTTVTRTVARFPSRRWWAVSTGLMLGHGRLANRWARHMAVTTYRPVDRPSALRHAHQAGMEAMAKPPSRIAMALALIALAAAIGWRIYQAWPPAPKPAGTNPASLIHQGGPWMGPLDGCHGTGAYTDRHGRCVVVAASR